MSEKRKKVRELFVGTNGRFFKGSLHLVSPGSWEIDVHEVSDKVVETETSEHRTIKVKEGRLRPAEGSDKQKVDRQAEIDAYLKKNKLSAEEAAEEITKKVKGKNKKVREIEEDLGYAVEFYVRETTALKEIPLIKEEVQQSETLLGKMPLYFKPSSRDIRKAVINYAQSKIK